MILVIAWDSSNNCAIEFTEAWWYNNCYYSNLNGQYGVNSKGKGVTWNTCMCQVGKYYANIHQMKICRFTVNLSI